MKSSIVLTTCIYVASARTHGSTGSPTHTPTTPGYGRRVFIVPTETALNTTSGATNTTTSMPQNNISGATNTTTSFPRTTTYGWANENMNVTNATTSCPRTTTYRWANTTTGAPDANYTYTTTFGV